MNKLLPVLFCFIFSFSVAQKQDFDIQSYRANLKDLRATAYSKDSTANAYFLEENGYSRYENDGDYNVITNYAAKIKILNKEGYEQGDIVIPLYKNKSIKERIRNLQAVTYNLEDEKVTTIKLSKKKVYTEENDDYDLVKFSFPDVKEGSVLTYTYQKESPFRYSFETWNFQGDIPKQISTFETRIPANFNYNIRKIGPLKLSEEKNDLIKECFQPEGSSRNGDCIHSYYEMENIPAFIEEAYLTSKNNYLSRLVYELKEVTRLDGYVKKYTKSWKDVDLEIKGMKSIGRQLRRSGPIKNLLPDSISAMPNSIDKAKQIYRFVQLNYKWDEEYHIYRDMNIKDVVKDKAGNVTGINILLHNLLELEGFNVLPVLSATRNAGFPSKLHPVLNDFNYMLVQLNLEEKQLLLDATEKYLAFGDLPFRALNGFGRLMDFKNGSSWVDIKAGHLSNITFRDSIRIQGDGKVLGTSRHFMAGMHALSARQKIDKIQTDEIAGALTNPADFTGIISTSFEKENTPGEPLQIIHKLENATQKINDIIYLNPFSFHFFEKNPLQLQERTYPIDFGFKDVYSYAVNVEIPENYKITEMPEQKLIRLPEGGGNLQFMVQQFDERNLQVQWRISFPRASYGPGYYPYLKKFFDNIIEIQNQSVIVLKENS